MISMNSNDSTLVEGINMAADAIIHNAGYGCMEDRILARHEAVERFFPEADELRARGIDVVKLVDCIEKKLIICKLFGDTVENLSADELNGALEHLLENHAARKAHRSIGQRRAHLEGTCSCCVA